jgi:porphobilinogen synthase
MRRLRGNPALRGMLAEVRLDRRDLIAPLFVRDGEGIAQPIPSMPGQFQFSPEKAVETACRWADLGIPAVLLFGVVDSAEKDEFGSRAWAPDGPVQKLTGLIKRECPDMLVFTDTCLCEYTDHGHCGPMVDLPNGCTDVDNDEALALLAKTAVSQARAGADWVAPSAMMDGQVARIRRALDDADLDRTGILSYAVKFASSMYGPFRDAAESPPQFGDRRTYQMDYRCPRQARLEAALDEAEGADALMVKPAATYLDVLADIRKRTDLPLAGYHVSGEYAQLKAAAQAGWIDEIPAMIEVTSAIKRAGADWIITYFAEPLAKWLDENR